MFPYCSFNMFNQKLEIKCITLDPVHTSSSFTRPHPVHTWPPRSHITTTITSHPFTCDHLIHTTTPRSHMTQFNMTNQFTQPQPGSHLIILFTWDRLVLMTAFRSHDVVTTPFTRGHPMDISLVYTWPGGHGTEKMFRPVSIVMPYMNQIH